MKNIKGLIFIGILVLCITSVFGQNEFNEGVVNYKVVLTKLDSVSGDISYVMNVGLVKKQEELKTTLDMSIDGANMSVVKVIDGGQKKGVLAMNIAGQKFAAKLSSQDYENLIAADTIVAIDKVEKLSETETILGYKCKKAKVTNKDGQVFYVWYTNAFKPLKLSTTPGGMSVLSAVDGFVLKFESASSDIVHMSATVTKVSTDAVNASEFTYEIPAGYMEVSYSELAGFQGAMN